MVVPLCAAPVMKTTVGSNLAPAATDNRVPRRVRQTPRLLCSLAR